jgi:hypothetical protein
MKVSLAKAVLADLVAGTVQLCFDSVIVWQQYGATGGTTPMPRS